MLRTGLSTLIFIVAVVGLGPAVHAADAPQPPLSVIELGLGSRIVHAEVARTLAETGLGLMHRTQLAPDAGMLFLFPPEQDRPCMWMSNTLLPLDVAFMDAMGRVVNVVERMQPHSERMHCATGAARYALELNPRVFAAAGIAAGSHIAGLPPPAELETLPPMEVLPLVLGSRRMKVELATTWGQKIRGLAFREALAPDAGLLMPVRAGYQGAVCIRSTFVRFATSVAFVNEEGIVLNTDDMAAGEARDACAVSPPRHVLLVPGGVLDAAGITRRSLIEALRSTP